MSYYRCLCGLMHVKLAVLIFGILLVVGGLSTLLKASVSFLVQDGSLPVYTISGLLNLIVGITTIYGAKTQRPNYLYPIMVQQVIVVAGLCLAFLASFALILPQVMEPKTQSSQDPGYGVMGAMLVILLTFPAVWILNVIYRCFEFMTKEKIKEEVNENSIVEKF
uniref:DUF4149 domain-containing protein n=1 Tax=Steinernema glaseri TaxID=37863 RepID=A0A1I7YU99_9BILA